MQKFLVLLAAASLAVADPIVYLIRHGEKPSNGSDGLSAAGLERAQCLKTVFGPSSGYDIGYIMAETPKSSVYRSGGVGPVHRLYTDLLSQAERVNAPTRPSSLSLRS